MRSLLILVTTRLRLKVSYWCFSGKIIMVLMVSSSRSSSSSSSRVVVVVVVVAAAVVVDLNKVQPLAPLLTYD